MSEIDRLVDEAHARLCNTDADVPANVIASEKQCLRGLISAGVRIGSRCAFAACGVSSPILDASIDKMVREVEGK